MNFNKLNSVTKFTIKSNGLLDLLIEKESNSNIVTISDIIKIKKNNNKTNQVCSKTGIPYHVFYDIGQYIWERSQNTKKEETLNLSLFIIENYFL